MERRTRLISIAVAFAVVVACVALAFEIAGFESRRSVERGAPAGGGDARREVRRSVARVPLAPAAVAPLPEPAEVALEGVHEPEAQPPPEWPPPRAFTERCLARGGACPEGCTELAGGRCLDPCFIHTAECSRDCRNPDGTCGFPPPDPE